MFEPLYNAYVHMPWVGWIAGTIMMIVVMRKLPYFYGMMLLLILFTFLDGLRAGEWLRLGGKGHALYEPFAYFFILFGDLRYFLLMYRYGKHHDLPEYRVSPWTTWVAIIAWTLAPTLLLFLGDLVLPAAFDVPRHIFLVYELIMFCAALLFLNGLLPSWFENHKDSEMFIWLRRVTYVEMAHYGLWALSDVLILSGVDAGYALRFVPDTIYYTFFIVAVYAFAPARLKHVSITSG